MPLRLRHGLPVRGGALRRRRRCMALRIMDSTAGPAGAATRSGRMTMATTSSSSAAGPSGATAARRSGPRRATGSPCWTGHGRIKPCGGAIPPRLIADFDIPDEQIVARISTARMISPTGAQRRHPDRERLCRHGRPRAFRRLPARPRRGGRGGAASPAPSCGSSATARARRSSIATRRSGEMSRGSTTRLVIGADGARSQRGARRGAGRRQASPMSSPTTRSSRRPSAAGGLRSRPLRRDL